MSTFLGRLSQSVRGITVLAVCVLGDAVGAVEDRLAVAVCQPTRAV